MKLLDGQGAQRLRLGVADLVNEWVWGWVERGEEEGGERASERASEDFVDGHFACDG